MSQASWGCHVHTPLSRLSLSPLCLRGFNHWCPTVTQDSQWSTYQTQTERQPCRHSTDGVASVSTNTNSHASLNRKHLNYVTQARRENQTPTNKATKSVLHRNWFIALCNSLFFLRSVYTEGKKKKGSNQILRKTARKQCNTTQTKHYTGSSDLTARSL